MTVNFENYGEFLINLTFANDNTHCPEKTYTLKKAFDLIEQKMYDGIVEYADIIDATTGEVVAICKEEEESSDYDYEPDYDECGFNPYMGCYDFDC